MSAAATQRARMLAKFSTTGSDGVPESKLIEIGGLYWGERKNELCAEGHPIGWLMVEGEKRYFLVAEPDVERASDTMGSTPVAGEDAPSSPVASSLDIKQSTLFPSGSSHYEIEAKA